MLEKLDLHFLFIHSFISHLGVTICLTHSNILECELRQQMYMHLTVAKLFFLFFILCGYCHCIWYMKWQFTYRLGMICVHMSNAFFSWSRILLPYFCFKKTCSPVMCRVSRAALPLVVHNLASGMPDWFSIGSQTEQNSSVGPDSPNCGCCFAFHKSNPF